MTAWKRFARFNVVSAIGMVVQVAAIWILVDLAGVPYVLATAGAVSLAVVHNFVGHRLYTWADRRLTENAVRALSRFVLANGVVSLVGNVVLMILLVKDLRLATTPASIVAIGACGLLNFCLADRVVFTDAARDRQG
jgi:putative flippase GtrA